MLLLRSTTEVIMHTHRESGALKLFFLSFFECIYKADRRGMNLVFLVVCVTVPLFAFSAGQGIALL